MLHVSVARKSSYVVDNMFSNTEMSRRKQMNSIKRDSILTSFFYSLNELSPFSGQNSVKGKYVRERERERERESRF
jgi:hypothetical protein